jgi:hypothetical protein
MNELNQQDPRPSWQQIAEHIVTILINLSTDHEILENLASDNKFLAEVFRQIVVSRST